MSALVWVVDDDRSIRWVLERALVQAGYRVQCFADGASALKGLSEHRPDLVFSDVRMPGLDGLSLLKRLAEQLPDLPVVVMSAYTDLSGTVAAFHGGAFDYLAKPFDLDVAIALAKRALPTESPTLSEVSSLDALVGDTPAMREVFRALGRLSRSELNVLVTGETGTGKELIARALHQHSPRSAGPFIGLNTAAVAAELLESELFGHEQGAFTGAVRRHAGRFEQAEGGTLFLDEIGDMPLSLQTRLLRVLAEGEYYALGGRALKRANVRLLAATHQDLEAKAARGEFRADLLHRLNVVRIHLPPLRERRSDIAQLAQRFLSDASVEMRLESKAFSAEALAKLSEMAWPGNVRELRNLCQKLLVLSPGRQIIVGDLVQAGTSAHAPADTPQSNAWATQLLHCASEQCARAEPAIYERAHAQFEQALFEAALQHSQGDRQRAAKLLGIGRNTLTRKLGPKRGG